MFVHKQFLKLNKKRAGGEGGGNFSIDQSKQNKKMYFLCKISFSFKKNK